MRLLLLALALGGCGPAAFPVPDGGTPPPTDAGSRGPTGLAQTNGHTRDVLAHPKLVTVTFSGYGHTAVVEALGAYLMTSDWLTTVGADYGVGSGSSFPPVELTETAPAMINDVGVRAMIDRLITANTLPAPGGANADILYLFYFPIATSITDNRTGLGTLCDGTTGYAGYHEAGVHAGTAYAYGVLANCGQGIDVVTGVASHEIIEAATDPFNAPNIGYYVDAQPPDPYYFHQYDEVGDLCEGEDYIQLDGFAVQRIWSDSAARTGNPCVPLVPGLVYANVVSSPAQMPTAQPGTTVTFTLTGWATGATNDWNLSLHSAWRSDVAMTDLSPMLSATTINVGRTVTLTLSVPSTATAGQIGGLDIGSGHGRVVPVGFIVGP